MSVEKMEFNNFRYEKIDSRYDAFHKTNKTRTSYTRFNTFEELYDYFKSSIFFSLKLVNDDNFIGENILHNNDGNLTIFTPTKIKQILTEGKGRYVIDYKNEWNNGSVDDIKIILTDTFHSRFI